MTFPKHFHSARLHLHPVRWRDAFFVYQLLGDPEVRQFLGGPVERRARLARFRAYRRHAQGIGVWCVSLRTASRPIGMVVLAPHQSAADHEVSYMFKQNSWGNGYATEALGCVVRYAIETAGLKRVLAETQSANTASCRLLSKVGMAEIDQIERFGQRQAIYAATPSLVGNAPCPKKANTRSYGP